MKKLLIGGSPCTHWSIAQHNERETEASGMGWELFKCYLAAKEKFKPDYFLYENNRSAYVIRKLKPVECERLQTVPDGYTEGVADNQRYKALGNGWTAEVIKFILSHMDAEKDEPIVVLSMFDGIATGRYVLESLGYTNVTYYAYEIDEPAKTIALKNYPDIIQLGDAFDLHREDWKLGKLYD